MEGSVARLADDGQKKKKKRGKKRKARASGRQWTINAAAEANPPCVTVSSILPRSFPCKDRNRPLTFRRVIGPWPTLSIFDSATLPALTLTFHDFFFFGSVYYRSYFLIQFFEMKRNQASIYPVLCIGFRC